MKIPITPLCILLCILISPAAKAQKPFLFKSHPAFITVSEKQLNSFLSGKQGNKISVPLSGNFAIEGDVLSNQIKYNCLQTMVLKVSSMGDMLFSISKRINTDKSVGYTGHLFSKDYADGYELKRNENNMYQLVKIEMEKILPACNQ